MLLNNISSVSLILIITLLLSPEGTDFVHGWWFSRHCWHKRIRYDVGDKFEEKSFETNVDDGPSTYTNSSTMSTSCSGHTYLAGVCTAYLCTRVGKITIYPAPNNCPPPPTTTTPTTTTTTPTTTPPRCYYNGQFYTPGLISSGRTGNWCYITRCDVSGQVISGDHFNCLPTTTPLTTTPPIPTTTPLMCYHNGQYYTPGLISSGRTGNWCYLTRCDESGQVISGDHFNCLSTTPPPTTTPPTPEKKWLLKTPPAPIVDRVLKLLEQKIKRLT